MAPISSRVKSAPPKRATIKPSVDDTVDPFATMPPLDVQEYEPVKRMSDKAEALKKEIDEIVDPAPMSGTVERELVRTPTKKKLSDRRQGPRGPKLLVMARGVDVEQELVSTQGKLHETQAQLDTTSQELKMMQDDASSRQDSYMRRETKYRVEITRLQSLADKSTQRDGEDTDGSAGLLKEVRNLHTDVQAGLDAMIQTTYAKFQARESDALRAFRMRIREVEEEIKAERERADDGIQMK